MDPLPPVDELPVDPLPPVDELPVDPLPPVDELPVDPLPPVDELPVDPLPPVDPVVRSIVLEAKDIVDAWTGEVLVGSRDADGMNGGAGDDHIQGRQGDDRINGDDVGSFTSRLSISASISDQVSPDDVRIVVSGMPADAVLSAGARNADGSWTLMGSQLDGLMISAPDAAEFKLHIEAFSTDGSGLEAATDIKVSLVGGFNDVIEGGRGNDIIHGQAGDDVIYGGSKPTGVIKAPPAVPAADDNDWIDAGDGNDVVYAGSGNDTVFGGTGNDWISGGRGDDLIAGQDGDDFINGNSGNDMIWGDAGNDEIVGGSGNDTIWGGDGDDVIKGGSGDDVIYTDAGTDTIYGGSGFDTLVFSSAPGDTNTYYVDLSKGFVGNDEVGYDQLSSIEAVIGGYGNDNMIGSTKANLLVGGAGNDTLRGGAGADTLTGGEGKDTFVFLGKDVAKLGGASLGMDLITDFEVGDVVDLTDLTATRKAVYSLKDDGHSTILLAEIKGHMVEVVKFQDFTGHTLDEMIHSGMLLV